MLLVGNFCYATLIISAITDSISHGVENLILFYARAQQYMYSHYSIYFEISLNILKLKNNKKVLFFHSFIKCFIILKKYYGSSCFLFTFQ